MNFKERVEDIEDVIIQVSGHMGVPMTDLERKSIARRLANYHGPELFRILLALHEGKFFPSGAELEQRVRKAMGKDPAKGISEEFVERTKAELIAQGQSPDKAEGGARIARASLRVPPREEAFKQDLPYMMGLLDYVNQPDALDGDLFENLESPIDELGPL